MQPTKRFSQLTPDAAPTTDDYFATTDATSGQSKKVLLSDLLTLFFTQTAIPAGGGSPVTRHGETLFDFVASGGVWAGDSYAVNRNASMTAMICYINGYRISIAAVSARTFTASKDTYIDVLSNQDGTGTLVYTEVANNAASPALASNSIRIGIIVTGATTIAAVASINQGQENKVLPIASSIAYSVTDSLGNLIYSRDSSRRTLGFRRITANDGNTGAVSVTTGLTCAVIVPTGRRVKVFAWCQAIAGTASGSDVLFAVNDGTIAAGTLIGQANTTVATNNHEYFLAPQGVSTPATASKTYEAGHTVGSGTATLLASATVPAFIKVELD